MTILHLGRLNRISHDMQSEAEKARLQYRSYNSFHEAYAVLLEELEELWHLIKIKQTKRNDFVLNRMKKEIIQIGSISMLMMHDFNLMARSREIKNE